MCVPRTQSKRKEEGKADMRLLGWTGDGSTTATPSEAHGLHKYGTCASVDISDIQGHNHNL